ncbi:hypothetical protein [Yoonia sp. 2307UL14-13]|uniref:hypothetical protein n=1 Tax=Yoonia sp. 2307UL14-13 TaxID=3126506 RepID=UPI0030948DA8
MRSLRQAIAALLAIMVAVFCVQNTALLEYRFLNATLVMHQSAAFLSTLAIGVLIGWAVGRPRMRRK